MDLITIGYSIVIIGGAATLTALAAINVIRPTERGLIERMGKYNRFAEPGLNLTIPFIERITRINITEQMVDAESQEIITKDKLNATVDAQIYFKVKPDEENVMNSEYNVNDYGIQIVSLARTTLRNIIGTMMLTEANTERDKINLDLMNILAKETKGWGLEIVRTELKEINPPADVQETMNRVVKAENEKAAAVDFATAKETEADGSRRAAIKQAEGSKQARILEAEGIKEASIIEALGKAKAIETVNVAAEKYFVGNAQVLRKIDAAENALKNNSKIIVPQNMSIVNVLSDIAGVVPVDMKGKK